MHIPFTLYRSAFALLGDANRSKNKKYQANLKNILLFSVTRLGNNIFLWEQQYYKYLFIIVEEVEKLLF